MLTAEREYQRFERQLVISLKEYDLEDGMIHPAEEVLQDVFRICPDNAKEVIEQLADKYLNKNQMVCAGLVQCLGRLDDSSVPEWKYSLAEKCLREGDAGVREASVICLEYWGGQEAVDILSAHNEKEGWLADYISSVIKDLN